MGQSCAIHQKAVSSNTQPKLKTSSRNLVNSALKFGESPKPSPPESSAEEWVEQGTAKGAWQDNRDVKAGHFNEVYLRGLKKTVAESKERADCTLEDLEGKEEEEEEVELRLETKPVQAAQRGEDYIHFTPSR